MILDTLKNSALYASLNPRIAQAFKHIESLDLAKIEPGRYEIDGDKIFMMIDHRALKLPADAALEVHDRYIDIQIVIEGAETFGWRDRAKCTEPRSEMNTEKDIQFFDDSPSTYYTMTKGQFCILLPGDAHAPLVGDGKTMVRKCIIKVLL